jgi:5-methylcytosine-specific restriction endonuclease McrA
MEQSSQGQARRARRPWTDEEQRLAEDLLAHGATWHAIGKRLGTHSDTTRGRLDPEYAERRREKRRQWGDANKGQVSDTNRRYRERNREELLDYYRSYYLAHAEKYKEASTLRRAADPQRHREMSRLWRQSNPHASRDMARRSRNARRAAHRQALSPATQAERLFRYRLFCGQCAYCGATGRLTDDHVLALSAGGLDEAANIVPACSRCNGSKHARPVEGWYRRQPFFTEARWREIQRHCSGVAAGQLPLAFSTPA